MKPDLLELPPTAPVGPPNGPSEGASPGAQARNGGRPQGSAAVAVTEGKRADRSSKLSAAASGRTLMKRSWHTQRRYRKRYAVTLSQSWKH